MNVIELTEKYVRELHPNWSYDQIKKAAFYIRVDGVRRKAKKLGVKLLEE